MKPAFLDAKAACRASAANAEGEMSRMRRAGKRKSAVLYEAAARAFYDAAFEYGRGESGKAMKRKADGETHMAMAKACA